MVEEHGGDVTGVRFGVDEEAADEDRCGSHVAPIAGAASAPGDFAGLLFDAVEGGDVRVVGVAREGDDEQVVADDGRWIRLDGDVLALVAPGRSLDGLLVEDAAVEGEGSELACLGDDVDGAACWRRRGSRR